MPRPISPVLAPLGALALFGAMASCSAPKVAPLDLGTLEAAGPAQDSVPDFVNGSPDEWVRLTSGEWLRGEVAALTRGTLEFDSEELDDLNLDWEDVAEMHSKRSFTVLFEDQSTATGAIRIQGDVVRIQSAEGDRVYARKDIQRIVTGAPSERDHWSGKAKVGFSGRSGNTDQTDLSFTASAKRRTAATRLELLLDTLESSADDSQIANNQRLKGQFDYYVTSRLYLIPLGFELFRDRFLNLDLRVSPFAGLGYMFVDRGPLEWDGLLGVGYRYTQFDSVAVGEDDVAQDGFGTLGTSLSADLTEKIELEGSWQAQISFDDVADTNQNAWLALSYDVWGDLDFDVRLSWNRIGDPEVGSDGFTPEKDDIRIDVGVSWSF